MLENEIERYKNINILDEAKVEKLEEILVHKTSSYKDYGKEVFVINTFNFRLSSQQRH